MGNTVLLKKYRLGDMQALYFMDDDIKNVELIMLPENVEPLPWNSKNQVIDSLVQIKLAGDTYLGGYAGGGTLRQGESVSCLKYESQECNTSDGKTRIITVLRDERGYLAEHILEWFEGTEYVEMHTVFYNNSDSAVSLEMLSSFSLGGITPCTSGDAHDTLLMHRIRSVWSMEGRVETRSIEDLQLEPSWAGHAVRSERFGQIGSMPVNHYFPFVAIEDTQNDILWGAQIAHNASWQMELYRKDDGLSVSGGLADREFGHWMKNVGKNENFSTPVAIVSVCKGGGIDYISQRLTASGERFVNAAPESEQELPIIFNEYCTTWGCPSHENISEILSVIKNKGISYFVIDCGWYKEDGVPWDISMGDYNVSNQLFPNGLEKTVEAIRKCGMKPGIWFEIENVGEASRAYNKVEHLLKRDGKVLTTTMRRFWDMRDPWVQKYLTDKVINFLNKYDFEYLKMDYNDTVGVGCDGAESIGEGLRQNMAEAFSFVQKIKENVSDIILENCASGGHRLEPSMMRICSMASFSDAHECPEIPVIAANFHRTILPRQSQIWAVIRNDDSNKRIAYSIAATFLGRMCLSGDVTRLEKSKWDVIDKGIEFYKKISHIIKDGYTSWFGSELGSYRHLKGWHGILRTGKDGSAYVVYHVFDGVLPDECRVELDKQSDYRIEAVYSDSEVHIRIEENSLIYKPDDNWKAAAVLLIKNNNQ